MKALLCLLVVAVSAAGCGSETDVFEVHPDGRIGPLKIDVSTEREVREFAGRPFKVEENFSVPGERVGHTLWYRCGRGCTTSYAISTVTGRLSDYWTNSRRFVTQHGSRIGMPTSRAVELEGRKPVPGCGYPRYIHLRFEEKRIFVLAIFKGRVDAIVYLGPHTVTYEGLC